MVKEAVEEGKKPDKKEKKVPAFWLDEEEWDDCLLPKSKVPKGARTIGFKGEQVYLLERVNGNGEFKPYRPSKPIKEELTAAKVHRGTRFVDLLVSRRYRPKVERNEKFEKGILYAFILGSIAFMALIVIIVMG